MPQSHPLETMKPPLMMAAICMIIAVFAGVIGAVPASGTEPDAAAEESVCQLALARYREAVIRKIENPTDPSRRRRVVCLRSGLRPPSDTPRGLFPKRSYKRWYINCGGVRG